MKRFHKKCDGYVTQLNEVKIRRSSSQTWRLKSPDDESIAGLASGLASDVPSGGGRGGVMKSSTSSKLAKEGASLKKVDDMKEEADAAGNIIVKNVKPLSSTLLSASPVVSMDESHDKPKSKREKARERKRKSAEKRSIPSLLPPKAPPSTTTAAMKDSMTDPAAGRKEELLLEAGGVDNIAVTRNIEKLARFIDGLKSKATTGKCTMSDLEKLHELLGTEWVSKLIHA